MPWSKMLFPLLFLALGAACLWAAWVFRRFAKKRETTYTVKAWAQVVQVLASADSDGDPLYTPVLHLLAEGESYTKRGSPTREEGRFQTGAWVEVRYPPGRPSRFMQAGEVGTSAASAVLCLGAFLCFVGALVQLVQNWNLFFRPRSIKFIKTLDFSFGFGIISLYTFPGFPRTRGDVRMLKNWARPEKPEGEELKQRLKAAEEKLSQQQMKLKEKRLPVLVLIEGWGAAGKGSAIGQIIKNIDPRFFKVFSMPSTPTEEERRRPFLYRFFEKIPEAGKFTFLDSGWMDQIMKERLDGKLDDKAYAQRVDSVKRFERGLTDNGYLVLKFFFHISKKEQENRIEALLSEKDTAWRVSEGDLWQNRHYDKCLEAFDRYLDDTNTPSAPWYIVNSKSKKFAELQVMETLCMGIETALHNESLAVPLLQNAFPLIKMPKLRDVPLEGKTLDEEEYKKELKELQAKLGQLHNRLYRKRVPVIIAYEGWDAAGKGGNIKRLTGALDPRGFEVHPIASPEPHEKARHYLWRFWTRLPKDGHIAIFDRTWYGRVMVERLEGFCSENDWQRAYYEMNEFEQELHNWGAVILKFWVQIDKDTQLARFTERQNTPSKQWKITDEDWRNREKWDLYEQAVDEMLQKTSTTYAPWHILESVDKKYARIKALHIVIDALQKAL